jgi:hypothetical protein
MFKLPAISSALLVAVVTFVIYTYLIQQIWNKVLCKKFPNCKIRQLTFFETAAFSVFIVLLSGSNAVFSAVLKEI